MLKGEYVMLNCTSCSPSRFTIYHSTFGCATMEYQVSARKYRPMTFEDVIGQPHVVRTLGQIHYHEAYRPCVSLFRDPRGGKTTIARILAKALNCEPGRPARHVTPARTVLRSPRGRPWTWWRSTGPRTPAWMMCARCERTSDCTPFRGRYRVYIIDEVHMLSNRPSTRC